VDIHHADHLAPPRGKRGSIAIECEQGGELRFVVESGSKSVQLDRDLNFEEANTRNQSRMGIYPYL
jgi:hypothetical protein